MTPRDHAEMAREMARRAEEETTNGGNELIAAELLWGAFAHCLITVALNEGQPHDSHRAFQAAAQRLDATQGSNRWRSRFGSAERLHFHFYHGTLPTDELQSHKQATLRGTMELLQML